MNSTIRFDVPGPRRVLTTEAERVAEPLRRAARLLADELGGPEASSMYEEMFGPRDIGLGTASDPARRAWALVGMWAVARLSGDEGAATLAGSEGWFFGHAPRLAAAVPDDARQRAENSLASIDLTTLGDLLPYGIDPHGAGTRRAVLRNADAKSARAARRRHGIYYTPGDLAEFMTGLIIEHGDEAILDPACGTGVFLRAAARRLWRERPPLSTISNLYGLDVDAIAIDGACFVLTAVALARGVGSEPWRIWHLVRLNHAVADTISLLQGEQHLASPEEVDSTAKEREAVRRSLQEAAVLPEARTIARPSLAQSARTLFPEVRHGFAVVANPPYAPLGARADLVRLTHDLDVLKGSRPSPSTNSFLPFLQAMWSLSAGRRRSTMVVPLSIAYNTTAPFVAARRAMVAAGGTWSFRFFDRTPDALFGDDVKQRTAIVTRLQASGPARIQTTALRRWTSHRRHQLFEHQGQVTLEKPEISNAIPKVGEAWETSLLRTLRSRPERLSDEVRPTNQEDSVVADCTVTVGATAYNRLVVYLRDGQVGTRINGIRLTLGNPTRADWAYAVLVSTVVYWLWRVDGDGFHVPQTWLLGLPFEWRGDQLDIDLAKAGSQAWAEARTRPIVAVNSGRRTTSFDPPREAVAQIDRLILGRVPAANELATRLAAFRHETIDVGRGRP